MIKSEKLKKIFRIALSVVICVIVILFGVLCGVVSKKNREIEKYKESVATYEQTIREKDEMISKLASMEAVRCEVSLTVKNTAVMGSNKTGDTKMDAYQVATYLRGEILDELLNSN